MNIEKLRIDINFVLSLLQIYDKVAYPKLHINEFEDLLKFNFNNVKLVVLNKEPLLRPDSTGLSCFYKSDMKIKENFIIKNFKTLLGEDFNDKKDFYQDEGVLFLNQSLTSSNDYNNSFKFWEHITNKILREVTKAHKPIILSVGDVDTYQFAWRESYRPLLIDMFIEGNLPIEHIPLDHTYLIGIDCIGRNLENVKKDCEKYQVKNLINNLLEHKNIKKIDW